MDQANVDNMRDWITEQHMFELIKRKQEKKKNERTSINKGEKTKRRK